MDAEWSLEINRKESDEGEEYYEAELTLLCGCTLEWSEWYHPYNKEEVFEDLKYNILNDKQSIKITWSKSVESVFDYSKLNADMINELIKMGVVNENDPTQVGFRETSL